MTLQALANGQLARASEEPSFAALVNVTVALAVVGAIALATLATRHVDAPPWATRSSTWAGCAARSSSW